jgi:hypothetical protein
VVTKVKRRQFLDAGAGSAVLAWLVRGQSAAAATTGLFTDQQISPEYMVMRRNGQDGSHDFDFWFGSWKIHNERLKQRLVGCNDWEQFDAIGECAPILGGVGNIDSFETDWHGDFRGMTLRLFNLKTKQWSLYWASNRDGVLEPPVVGAFSDGIGRFEGPDQHQGKPVRTRFVWSHITPVSASWEQAMSADGGQTWETNWRMQMSRIR